MRIGEVASRTGTTTRTVRYYEEIGLLPGSGGRARGSHRLFSEADVARLEELLRLKELLNLSLDDLRDLLEADDARALLRAEWQETEDEGRRRAIIDEALGHIGRQLELVRGRRAELERLERDLVAKHRRLKARERELREAPVAHR